LALVARAHVLALPSLWAEPFGLATLEGMALGCAAMVSDAGASPELVEDGASGVVVAAGDARAWARELLALESDEAQRVALAEAGRARVLSRFRHADFVARIEAEALSLASRP